MLGNSGLAPLQPLLVADRFAPLGAELLTLLRSLRADDWQRRTVAPAWSVRDVTAHLLDTALRRLSFDRDGHSPPPPQAPIRSYRDLVVFLDDLNAEWVSAWRRVSPALLVDALARVEHDLAAFLPAVDPFGEARFGVAWAGEESSRNWFDLARELTERWHHQQQIRLAVGAPELRDPLWSEPVFETFLYALPHRFGDISAAEGTTIAIAIEGERSYRWALCRDDSSWELLHGTPAEAAARVAIPESIAWRAFTKALPAEEARASSQIEGERALAAPIFGTLAVMA